MRALLVVRRMQAIARARGTTGRYAVRASTLLQGGRPISSSSSLLSAASHSSPYTHTDTPHHNWPRTPSRTGSTEPRDRDRTGSAWPPPAPRRPPTSRQQQCPIGTRTEQCPESPGTANNVTLAQEGFAVVGAWPLQFPSCFQHPGRFPVWQYVQHPSLISLSAQHREVPMPCIMGMVVVPPAAAFSSVEATLVASRLPALLPCIPAEKVRLWSSISPIGQSFFLSNHAARCEHEPVILLLLL
jgi:hypothetical protein